MSDTPEFKAYEFEAKVFDAPDRPELAKYLGTSQRYIEDLDAKREGPPRVWIAGKWRYPRKGVDDWIRSRIEAQCNAHSGARP